MTTFNINEYKRGTSKSMKSYVEVPDELDVKKGDTFEGWLFVEGRKPSKANRRAKPTPSMWKYRVATVEGIGESFSPELFSGPVVKRCYVSIETTEEVEAE